MILIIAEAGVNHNGSLERALALVDAAAEAGADFVKFQTFRAERIISRHAPKAEYQVQATGAEESQLQMVKKLELDRAAHEALMDRAQARGILFISTPFDEPSADLLVELGVPLLKISSGEIVNLPLLRHIARLGKPVVMSTGMATLAEVEQAVAVLESGGLARRNLVLLHCNTEYPTPMGDVNLRAMETLRHAFPGVKVGYSDHTAGFEVCVAAAALGAAFLEKHFTLDRRLPGPDHQASLEPGELKAMVRAVRHIELALGDGIKRPTPSEAKNIPVARKSIVALKPIRKGERFDLANLAVKRPGSGISPMRWDEVLGRAAPRDFAADELIEL